MVDKNEDSPEVRKQFTEVQKAKDLEQIGGNADSRQSEPGYAAGLASAQEAAEKRSNAAKAKGSIVNLGDLPSGVGGEDPGDLSGAEQARIEKERAANRSPRGLVTGILRPGTAPTPVRLRGNVNEGEAGENNLERIQKGMGIAGQENGEIKEAHAIRLRRHQEGALRETPTLDAAGGNAAGSHEHRLVKVMSDLGVTEDALKSDPFDTGMNTENRVDAIHTYVQAARDAKAEPIRQTPEAGDYWEHPTTGQVHAVTDNHPDMPKVFERNKGMSFTYSRNRQGQLALNRGVYEGWNREKSSGGEGGVTVWRKRSAPKNHLGNVVDLIRKAYQNPETSNLKASGAYGIGRTLLGSINGVSTRVSRAIPNITGGRDVPAVGPFTKSGVGPTVRVSSGEPVQLVEPLTDKNNDFENGEEKNLEGVLPPKTKSGRVLKVGMESSGIPESRSGKVRVRKFRGSSKTDNKKAPIIDKDAAAADQEKKRVAKTAARRGNLFKGPRPEEYDGQLAFDFRPKGEGPSPQFRGVSSASKVEFDSEGWPKPPPLGYKQTVLSRVGTKYVDTPRSEEVGTDAGVGPGQTQLRSDIVRPDVHTVVNLLDTTPVARNPVAEGRPSGKPILPKYDNKNEVVEGTGTKGGNGYEQPALPGFEIPGSLNNPHSKGPQWDHLLGGKVVNQAAGDLGKTTSKDR